ncbi:MAG: class IV adenylate cyclase [Anaerolineae bacterium]|jgi:adenylate cyclase class 2|nr:class IV adenylate cyclase [Anaerolineae bacterium]
MSLPLEIEGKWLVKHLRSIEFRLHALGAVCIQPRLHENNLRFDTPSRELSNQWKVLRLRQDSDARFTFKAPQQVQGGIRSNIEIEFTVGDYELGKQFLEALGYEVYFQYEKFRAVYLLEDCHIMLDELPYGDFVEIEGKVYADIADLAAKLELDLAASSTMNYARLFEYYCQQSGSHLQHLTFAAFENLTVTPEQLGLRFADEQLDE